MSTPDEKNGKVNHHYVNAYMKILMSITTACAIGIFGFCWNINTAVTVLQEKDRNNDKRFDNFQNSINEMRLSQFEQTDKNEKLERKVDRITIILENKKK